MQAAIQALHVANRALNGPRLVLISAGGSSLPGKLCAVPGASATLLEAQAPYALAATDDILGYKASNCRIPYCRILIVLCSQITTYQQQCQWSWLGLHSVGLRSSTCSTVSVIELR